MSTVLSERNRVRARKVKQCCLCGERIEIGALKDVRKGVDSGDMWVMDMHPECHQYESVPGAVDPDWYENISDSAFDRSEAIAHASKIKEEPKP